jgi:hypothetical protein
VVPFFTVSNSPHWVREDILPNIDARVLVAQKAN